MRPHWKWGSSEDSESLLITAMCVHSPRCAGGYFDQTAMGMTLDMFSQHSALADCPCRSGEQLPSTRSGL
jgi:hypothetical protein